MAPHTSQLRTLRPYNLNSVLDGDSYCVYLVIQDLGETMA